MRIKFLIIIAILMMIITISCFPTFNLEKNADRFWQKYHLYKGPKRSKKELGRVYFKNQDISSIDSQIIDQEVTGWKNQYYCVVFLLPEEHTILIKKEMSYYGLQVIGEALLNFRVEKGHKYWFRDCMEDTSIFELHTYEPYIKDHTDNSDRICSRVLRTKYDLLGFIGERNGISFNNVLNLKALYPTRILVKEDEGKIVADINEFEFEVYYEHFPNDVNEIIYEKHWYSEGDLIRFRKVKRESDDKGMYNQSILLEYKTYILTPSGDWYKIR